jgi:hypothetical protein
MKLFIGGILGVALGLVVGFRAGNAAEERFMLNHGYALVVPDQEIETALHHQTNCLCAQESGRAIRVFKTKLLAKEDYE